ncbi:MAG: electron transfer flavoprotein subunit beta/FixA family protein [Spirochaetes bacterium]|nr:electron transfer flavoprotein subunit beta/FixA family protein [Spirochaetota bacterium]
MNILVFIKQVPHVESSFEISSNGSTIEFSSQTAYAINSYDEYALEEALILSEKISHTIITVVTIGRQDAETALRRALAMGAHFAYHYVTENESIFSSAQKAKILSQFAKNHPFDLIITGTMSMDSAHAAIGPMIAAHLSIPWATHIIALDVNPIAKEIRATREIDVSTRQSITLPLPALISVQSGINRPRYPTLSHTLRAKKQEIYKIALNEHPHQHSQCRFLLPPRTKETFLLRGSREENARALYEYLRARSFL